MAVRDDFTPGEVLAAADLNDTFGSKLPYSYGTATPSTTDSGFLWYDSNSTPAAPKFWDGAAFQALTSGKILQVVRATDGTNRTTTSTTFTDVGISVTITPTFSDSAILLIHIGLHIAGSAGTNMVVQITDSSNNAISGAPSMYQSSGSGGVSTVLIGYATPATTSAVTYKTRYRSETAGTARIDGNLNLTQLYAMEIRA